MEALLNKIESYGFECQAGPLHLCQDWMNLRAQILLALREQPDYVPRIGVPPTDQPADRVSMPFDAFQIRNLTAQASANGDAHELSGDGIYRFAQCLWDAFVADPPAGRVQVGGLPPLPEPGLLYEDFSIGGVLVEGYTADQMREFARAALQRKEKV